MSRDDKDEIRNGYLRSKLIAGGTAGAKGNDYDRPRHFVREEREEPSEFGAAARSDYPKIVRSQARMRTFADMRHATAVANGAPVVAPQAWPDDKGKEGGRCNNGKCLKPLKPGLLINGAHYCDKCARLLGAKA